MPSPTITAGSQSQTDNFGWATQVPTSQILFSRTGINRLVINFLPDTGDDGFAPGDRFRFRAIVRSGFPPGGSIIDGDGIGAIGARVAIEFDYAGNPVPEVAIDRLVDTTHSGNNCPFNPSVQNDALGNPHLVVHPTGLFDLPCPTTSAPNNNGQAFIELLPPAVSQFAVRSQAKILVPSVIKQVCGVPLGPWAIRAKATAGYDFATGDPKLVHVDQFICTP